MLRKPSYCVRRNKAPNDKPVEDAAFLDHDSKIVAVGDGVTRLCPPHHPYPVPSPSAEATKIAGEVFCSTLRSRMDGSKDKAALLRSVCGEVNNAVRVYNEMHPELLTGPFPDLAAVSFLGAFIEENTITICSIGDCIFAGFVNNRWRILNTIQTAEMEKLRQGIPTAAVYHAERSTIRNRPDGIGRFGSFTGEPEALSFIEILSFEIDSFESLHMSSDGIAILYNENHPVLRTNDFEAIFDEMENIEASRSIRSDDKALIVLK